MQMNKWQAFLSDQELIEEYHHQLNGQFLFGKICHDALECLNNYLAILSLMTFQDVKISTTTLHWFASKKNAFQGFDNMAQSTEKELVIMALAKLSGVQALFADIQTENYKKLLTTRKYQTYGS